MSPNGRDRAGVNALTHLRVDQVGSLVRPDHLRRAIARHEGGTMPASDLRTIQDGVIAQVVRRQEDLGFPVVGDGELRRASFADSFAEVRESRAPDGRRSLLLERNCPLEEFEFTSSISRRPVKVTLLSVDRALRLYQPMPFASAGDDDLVESVITTQRRIVHELTLAGCRYIQVDSPGYAAYTDPEAIAQFRGRGRDPLELLRRVAAADSAVIAGFDEVTFAMHLCHRERSEVHRGELTYDGAAEVLFESLPHRRFLLECTSDHADFRALRFVPRDKVVVLGLVSTTDPLIEQEDGLLRRIDDASLFLPIDQLAISPQCGFAPVASQGSWSESAQWQKLELVLRVAERVWGTASWRATSPTAGAQM